MDLLYRYGVDPAKSTEGTWTEIGRTNPDDPKSSMSKIKIARMGNPVFQAALDKVKAPYDGNESALADLSIQRDILCRAIAVGILVDWANIEWEGEPLLYSEENAFMVLRDDRMEQFRDFITHLSRLQANYRVKKMEEDSGK